MSSRAATAARRRALLIKRFAANFTAHWWVVFVVVIVLPSVGLSIVSLRLIDRLAHDEVADLVRASESVPWYYEEKMNRALEERAIHAARMAGYETLADPRLAKERLEAAGSGLFDVLTVDRASAGPVTAPPAAGVLMATTAESALPLDDGDGHPIGTLRYRYSKAGLKAVLRECLNDRRAPWNDDSVEIFLGGPRDGGFRQDFDLHLVVRANDPALYERQGRTRDIHFASHSTAEGFTVEVAIPWRHVGVPPRAGSAIRFDLTNNDNDDSSLRKGQRTWAGYDRNWADPSRLGVLRLGTGAEPHGPREAIARPAAGPIDLDGRLSEPEWPLDNEAAKTEGKTDNRVSWGALWTPDALLIGVRVLDPKIVNRGSREEIDWVLRMTDPKGEALLDSSDDAAAMFGQEGSIDVRQVIGLGPLKGSQILFAFRDRPFARRVERWKFSALGLIAGMNALLGFGLWLIFTNVKREMDLAALKSHFVATVSHEFKAPLALLQASAETLRGGRVLDEEKRRRYEGIIEAESRRLASLVDNVLSVSRIEAGRPYHFAAVDVASVVDAALSLYRLKLEQAGFDVVITVPPELPPIVADAGAVQEALSNLIDNAIKYSRGRKRCRIEACGVNGSVEISVTDSGLGIAASDREKIFERFYRGEREGHGEQGVGLGLSIAREIAAAHGGSSVWRARWRREHVHVGAAEKGSR